MAMHFTRQIDVACFRPTESSVTLGLADMSGGAYHAFAAEVYGPKCRYARSLPATYQVPSRGCEDSVSHISQVTIPDPCYWTPRLPFLYECKLKLHHNDGQENLALHTIGLRRWELDGNSFFLDGRRFVLRGVALQSEDDVDLKEAHEAEVAVLATNPSEEFLQKASEYGVMIVADTRTRQEDLTNVLLEFTWQPAVSLVLPRMDACYVPHSQFLASLFDSSEKAVSAFDKSTWAKVGIIELAKGKQPPAALNTVTKPVVAISRGVQFSSLAEARTACDRLQAELAPEFDLAGYFVAP